LEIEGVIKFLFEMSTEVVIGVNVWWWVKDVVVSGCLRVLEDAGEEFCFEGEATITNRDVPVSAHRLMTGLVRKAPPVAIRSAAFCIGSSSFRWERGARP